MNLPASPSHVVGDLHLLADGTVEGWVWSPDQPDQRLVAEILVDDVRVGAIVSAMFYDGLVGQGIGDGHHGFRLLLPRDAMPSDGPLVITGRERRSKTVFARIVLDGPPITHEQREAIGSATGQMQALWAGLDVLLAGRPPAGQASRVRDAFAQLAALLAARARAPGDTAGIAAAVALETLGRAGRLDLPRCSRPAISIVLPAAPDVQATLCRLRALAPALAAVPAEILLVDDATDPATALLPALVPNLVYVRAGSSDQVAGSLAEATGLARGATVAVLEPTPKVPSATALLALAGHAAAAPQMVLLGPATRAACARVDAPGRAGADVLAPARLGLRIALARDLLVRAGGLEPAMVDGAALESVDLWLRCRLLGATGLAWREPARSPGDEPPRREHPRASLLALAAFRQRWRGKEARPGALPLDPAKGREAPGPHSLKTV
jgi:hypothetical protein